MLENSILIDGSQAKVLNDACKNYNDLNEQIKDMTKSKNIACDTVKSICDVGGVFETTKYIIRMDACQGAATISAKDVEKVAPDIFQKLVELDLMKIGNPYVKLGKITAK